MSKGYGGTAKICLQDDNTVIYKYAPYNLNEPEYRNSDRTYDGLIIINTASLVEPEIHEKIKRMPSGRKALVVKRIKQDVNYRTLLDNKDIIIENSKYCWDFVRVEKDIGMIAMKITFHIFNQYQEDGVLPEIVSINY